MSDLPKPMRLLCMPFVLLLVLPGSGCGSSAMRVDETLDLKTGITITHLHKPLILYRDSSGSAVYARGYAHVSPLRVNRMGHHRYYLWLGIWGVTHDPDLFADLDSFESIIVIADGEPISLTVAGWTPEVIHASQSIYVKLVAASVEAYYEITPDQLRLIGQARDVRLQTSGPQIHNYEPWAGQTTGPGPFTGFLEYVDH